MTTYVPNYTITGSPIISEDYILSYTSSTNIVKYIHDEPFDAKKSFDIIFKLKINSFENNSGILWIGATGSNNSIQIYYDGSAQQIYYKLGRTTLYTPVYIYDEEEILLEEAYYKVSYDLEKSYCYAYYSLDGENWVLAYSRSASTMPTITNTNLFIGRAYNSGIIYINEDDILLDLKELKVVSDGDTWFKAVSIKQDPIVCANEVYSINKTFKSKRNITGIDCNNVQFVNNDMSFAFSNCSNLVSVSNINQNTTNMAYAFAGCPTELYDTGFPTIPNSVNDITGLFSYHTNWTDIPVQAFVNAWSKVPAHLQTNVAGFLDGCTNLSNVPSNTLPNFMTNIAYAFRNCRAMTDMPIITENVVDMSQAFYGCSNLVNANYEIPNSVVNMSEAFYNCQNLTSAPRIGNSVVNMHNTFYFCNVLTSAPDMNNANSVVDMTNTFHNCIGLVNPPVIPNSVTNMHESFYFCKLMVNPPDMNNANSVVDMTNTFKSCWNLTSMPTIPESVINMIGTFDNCQQLISVKQIPNSVVNMNGTFGYCVRLVTPPSIPDSVIDMDGTFFGCSNMTTSPKLSNSTIILRSTFVGCYNMTTIPTIPNGVEDMTSAFRLCNKITSAPKIPNSVCKMNSCFAGCSNLKTFYEIPNSVTDMASSFTGTNISDASNISTATNVIDMEGIFSGCYNLVNAPILPDNVSIIGEIYYNCINLVNVPQLPESSKILYHSFYNCTNLVNAPIISNSATNMYETFCNCSNLSGNVYIYSNRIEVCNRCFQNSSLQKNVYIPYTFKNDFICQLYCYTNPEYNIKCYIADDFINTIRFGHQIVTTNIYDSNGIKNSSYLRLDGIVSSQRPNLIIDFGLYVNSWDNKIIVYDDFSNNTNMIIPAGTNSWTYNAFINVGYDESGTKDNVYLKDINQL